MSTGNGDQWSDVDRSRWSTYVVDWLRKRRLTQAQAAEALSLSGSTMTQWCRHGDRPSLPNAEAFGERIGGGADEGRRMGGYPAAAEAGASLEDLHRKMEEMQVMQEQILQMLTSGDVDPPLATRKGVVTMARTGRRAEAKYREDAPPL